MNSLARTAEPTRLDKLQPSARRDLLVVIAVAALTFVAASLLELNERILALTRPLEVYQIDELPITFLAMIIALAWFSWRRSRQALEEAHLRIATQTALIQREEQYRLLFMENLSGNVLMNAAGQIVLSNPAAARLLGMSPPGLLEGRAISDFFADPGQWELQRARLLKGEKIEQPMLELRRQDGSALRVVATLCPAPESRSEPEFHLYMTDVTELTRMQHKLADALHENRLLLQRYLEVQEDERRLLARELHDELGQSLNAIKVDAVSIRGQSAELPEIRRSAQAIIDVSSQVYETVRSLMRQLRPVALDELGLASAVQYDVEQWQRRHGSVKCEFSAEGELEALDEKMNITVYRLVQECLTNVAKHAAARNVRISIVQGADGSVLTVSVTDDGRGFDPGVRRQGLGLVGLRERVEALGGHLEIDSSPWAGTRIEAIIPTGSST